MTLRVDDFKATFRSGFARSNRYRVFFPDDDGTLSVMCDTIQWPGRSILTQERFVDFRANKIPYGFAKEDLSISFILDNDWTPWNYIYEWHETIVTNIEDIAGYRVNLKEQYARSDIRLQHLGVSDEVKKEVVFKNIYPISLEALDLGNGNENEVIRVSASFTYDNFEIE